MSLRWACLACGHRTIEANPPGPPGTYAICPVCFWEDTPAAIEDDYWARKGARSNEVDLRQAQRNVRRIGVVEEDFRSAVRPPLPGEEPDPGFQTLDEREATERTRLIAEIDAAFAGMSRRGGVSLHQTVLVDGCGAPGETYAMAAARDAEARWQDVPQHDLKEISGVGGIAFFDPIGYRYYLPAYLTWWLQGGDRSGGFAIECTLYSLDLTPPKGSTDEQTRAHREHSLKRFSDLTPRQARGVEQFLRFVLQFSDEDFFRKIARQALAAYWTERCK